jgi:formylglycine-generating enzyme required for sulfatase activity
MKWLLVAGTLLLTSPASLKAVVIPTVPVSNAGNSNDPLTGGFYGGVSYEYRIGTTEVTNAQYVEFLNAKAKSDSLGLYNVGMSQTEGGITRSGASGSYVYGVKDNMLNKPVQFVSWFDAIRFANWLNNGQGSGDTETGAYTILGGTAIPSNAGSISRNSGAIWFLPSENEWYKAAFHQPASQGGDVDDYWRYATASNKQPTPATANNVGDISNPGINVMNCDFASAWGGRLGSFVTTVGSAGPLSNSFYGTSDQGGNVTEWSEAPEGSVLRGGNYLGNYFNTDAFVRRTWPGAESEGNSAGFRVATVPEPSTYALAAIGIVALLAVGRRRS